MIISTKKQAFEILDRVERGFPFEAIEFLYQQPTDQEMLDKIQNALAKADTDAYYNEEIGYMINVELWYAILAEKHLDIALLDSIIDLVTQEHEDFEFVDEQVKYLIGLMGKKYGHLAAEKVLARIEMVLEDKEAEETSYLELFDILYFADEEKHQASIHRILKHPNNVYFCEFAETLCFAGMKSFLPSIKELMPQFNLINEDGTTSFASFSMDSLKATIQEMEEKGNIEDKSIASPYVELREDWKSYYQQHAELF